MNLFRGSRGHKAGAAHESTPLSKICVQCQSVLDHLPPPGRNYDHHCPPGYVQDQDCELCTIIFLQCSSLVTGRPCAISSVLMQGISKAKEFKYFDLMYKTDNGRWARMALVRQDSGSLPHEIQDSNSSAANWTLSKLWLEKCNAYHHCANRGSNKLPTRLIRISKSEEAVDPRLCLSEDLVPEIKYCTLSHCWGKTSMVTLQKENLEEFQKNISLHTLSKTFQQAIYAAKVFGFEYIWIDSLCIVQDDTDDWQREAGTMGDVFAGSSLNLAATAAADGQTGCFFPRPREALQRIRPVLVRSSSMSSQNRIFACQNPRKWQEEVEDSPLVSRGWVLQERFLGPRTLHFGASQVYWECSRLLACESFPFGLGSDVEDTRLANWNLKDLSGGDQPVNLWSGIVRAYSRTYLTRATDKLVAISGVAGFYQHLTGDEYVAGLWRRGLELQLLWEPESDSTRSIKPKTAESAYIAPSWSWASYDGPLYPGSIYTTGDVSVEISVLDAQAIPFGPDPLGQIKSASLSVRCHQLRIALVKTARISPRRLEIRSGEKPQDNRSGFETDYNLTFDTDPPEDLEEVCMMVVSLRLRYHSDIVQKLRGLLLQRTGQRRGEYRRLGTFDLGHPHTNKEKVTDFFKTLPLVTAEDAYDEISEPDEKGNTRIITLI